MHIFFKSFASIVTYLIYNLYKSIRIEEIHTVNTIQDRYLNKDDKDDISIRSKQDERLSFRSTIARIFKMMTVDMKNHDRIDNIIIETRAQIFFKIEK